MAAIPRIILDVLEEKRVKVICIDELDKMPKQFQEKLLNFMESGHINVEQQKKQYHFEIKGAKVFATCNEIKRLGKPLQSRFRKLFLPRYPEQQFIDVSIKVLPKVGENMARYIGFTVFRSGGDIREVMIRSLKPYQYLDEMVKGPFKRWTHLHIFHTINDQKQTEVIDEINFEIPYGRVGKLFEGYVYTQLQKLFDHRRTATIRTLQDNKYKQ